MADSGRMIRVALLVVLLWSVESSKQYKKNKKNRGLNKWPHSAMPLQDDAGGAFMQTPREKSSVEMINPSRSWETFINLAQSSEDDMGDVGGSYLGDLTAKSVGSKSLNSIEPIPGPRGPQGPPGQPGVVVLEDWIVALKMLKEAEGDIKRSKKGRYKQGGPVLNIVFNGDEFANKLKGNQSGAEVGRVKGFYSNLKADIYLQRESTMQLSNFNKPRVTTPFIFSNMLQFNHKSGSLVAPNEGAYTITATLNLQLMDDKEPGFEDHVVARICLSEGCDVWDLESYVPVLRTRYRTLHLTGTVQLEAGQSLHLKLGNNSPLDFKVLKSSGFSAYLIE